MYIYRIIHIDNVEHAIKHGLTHKDSINKNPNFKNIGDSSLIDTRSKKVIFTRKRLGDYIPFYFGYRSPMLYVIQKSYNGVPSKRGYKIVYCVTSVKQLLDSKIPFIYTDGHATDSFTTFYESKDIQNIKQQLDFKAIKARIWRDDKDLDLKEEKRLNFYLKKIYLPSVY